MRHLLDIAGVSDVGRARSRNEDSLTLIPEAGVAVVADGMGGHPGGDVASALAARTAGEALAARSSDPSHLDSLRHTAKIAPAVGDAMAECVLAAHEAVRAEAARNPDLESMGTTITAFALEPGTGDYAIGHVGDSRAYLFRGGRLEQLTRDDTWVRDRVDAGDLTPEQGKRHPYGHVLTQCLGLEPPTPHVRRGTAEEGDAYLLCTDGLVGMLEDDAIAEILGRELGSNGGLGRAEAAATALVAAANEAGGFDNVTVVVVVVGGRKA